MIQQNIVFAILHGGFEKLVDVKGLLFELKSRAVQ